MTSIYEIIVPNTTLTEGRKEVVESCRPEAETCQRDLCLQ